MSLNYNDRNLEKLLNSNNVLLIKPIFINKKYALQAVIKNENDYEDLLISNPQSKFTFPNAPIYELFNLAGYNYSKKFLNYKNIIAINSDFIDFINYEYSDNNIVTIFLKFSDNKSIIMMKLKKIIFEKFYKDNLILFSNNNNIKFIEKDIYDNSSLIEFPIIDSNQNKKILIKQKKYE